MKGIQAYWLCRRKGILTGNLSYRDFKLLKSIVARNRSWADFVKHLMMAIYITDAPDEPIIVSEVNFAIGGELLAVTDGKRIAPVSYGKIGENDWIRGKKGVGG